MVRVFKEGKQQFLLHKNTPTHRTKRVNEFLMNKQICALDQTPYSPDSRDYLLFQKLKTATMWWDLICNITVIVPYIHFLRKNAYNNYLNRYKHILYTSPTIIRLITF